MQRRCSTLLFSITRHMEPGFDVKIESSAYHPDKKAAVSCAWQILSIVLDLNTSVVQLPVQDSFYSVTSYSPCIVMRSSLAAACHRMCRAQ